MSKIELNSAVEIIKDRFFFVTLRGSPPKGDSHNVFFSIDNELVYEPFFADFGPLNLGHTYSYCVYLDEKLKDERNQHKRIYHYSSYDNSKRTNAVYLICAYSVLMLNCTPEEALRPFIGIHPPLLQFRDASVGPSTFGLPVIECLRGLIKAKSCGFFDMKSFNVNEYHFYERIENGDMNWIVPGKFLAFSGPHGSHHSDSGIRTLTPEDYIPYFKKHNVGGVVRLNKKLYDKRRFTEYGVRHNDMYFIDGSCPSDAIVQKFLELIEGSQDATAVHCKAGLGRTGTLIGCSLIKHHRFTAYEAIAWLRICRPGSVIGPQQHFLVQMQSSLWRSGELYQKRKMLADSGSLNGSTDLLTNNNTSSQVATNNNTSTPPSLRSSLQSMPPSNSQKSNPVVRSTSTKSSTSFSVSMSGDGGVTIGSLTQPTTTNTTTTPTHNQQNTHVHNHNNHNTPQPTTSRSTTGRSNSTQKERVSSSSSVLSSKEKLKADMRAITATLKSIRTSSTFATTGTTSSSSTSASTTSGAPSSPAPPPALYSSQSTPNASTYATPPPHPGPATSRVATSSPYTPQPSSRVNAVTSTKNKAPSGLALQQKKMENQNNRKGSLLSLQTGAGTLAQTTSAPSLRQPSPGRSTLSPAVSTPGLRTSGGYAPINYSTSSSSTARQTQPTTPTSAHRRTRSSGNVNNNTYADSMMSSPYSTNTTSSSSISAYSTSKTPYTTSLGGNYNPTLLASPTTSALLRSKTPPPPRREDYNSSSYGVANSTNYASLAYQRPNSRFLKT